MKELNPVTKKNIRIVTKCPGYIIDYLYDCGRLPVIQESKGRGYPTLYDPKAIDVVKNHMNKKSPKKRFH